MADFKMSRQAVAEIVPQPHLMGFHVRSGRGLLNTPAAGIHRCRGGRVIKWANTL